MSDTAIFLVGLFTFALLSWGIYFTFVEVRRLDEAAQAKRQSNRL